MSEAKKGGVRPAAESEGWHCERQAATCRQDRELCRAAAVAPDMQEEILFLPPTTKGKDAITLSGIGRVLAETFFARQRHLWRKLGNHFPG